METRCRGHGFRDVGSGVGGDLTPGQGLSSRQLGASGEKVGSHRQTGRALYRAREQMPSGSFSMHWAGDKAPHTKGKATVDLEVVQLTLCLSPIGHSTGHSPQPSFLCSPSEYLGRVRRCIWLEMMSCHVSFGFRVTRSV